MAERILHALLMQTTALALATLVVRALQWSVARRLGAASAYLCWLLVPVAMLAVALPRPAAEPLVLHVDAVALAPAWIARSTPVATATLVRFDLVAIAAWAIGALLLAAVLLHRQRRFERLLEPSSGRLPAGAGPAVLGVWRRRVVLPRDFDTAFDAEERRLMLLHEGVHLRRGDNAWNLLASALLVLHWFNPIAWWAWRRMRADQEMSCDAAVLRVEAPAALAAYAGALLKVQGVALAPPLATAWQSTHPLVERIRMLQVHRISPARHRAGIRLATLAVLLAGIGGHALQAGAGALPAAASPDEQSVMTTLEVTHTTHRATEADVDHRTEVATRVQLLARPGEPVAIRIGDGKVEAPYELGLTVSRLEGGRLQLDTRLSSGTPPRLLGSPRVVVHDGEKASLSIKDDEAAGEFAISMTPRVVATPAVPPVSNLPPPPAVPPVGKLPSVPPVPSVGDVSPVPSIGAVPAPPPLQRAL